MLVIFNPVAGRRRAAALWKVLDLLVVSGVKVEVAETQYAGHARILAREAAASGENLVVAAGGDGTVAEVANGLMGSQTAIGIIPLGTANVLAREYGLSRQPGAIAHNLAYRRTRKLWPGLARMQGRDQLFVQMVGLGFDGAVVHGIHAPLKRLTGRGAYVWQSLWESVAYRFPPLHLRIDGTAYQAASVVVSKGRLYGGPYMLAPNAQPEVQGFQVALFEHAGTMPALLFGAALPLGMLPRCPGIRIFAARHIEFEHGNAVIPAQADGDKMSFTPCEVTDAAAPIFLVAG